MLSLFKPSYYLKDLLPDNYIDIHNHILPRIDDGAKTIEEACSIIEQMKSINIKGVIATPHTFTTYWNNTQQTIQSSYNNIFEIECNSKFLKGFASEYMLDGSLIERIQQEKLLCIMDNYLLIELSPFSYSIDLYEMLFELKSNNYKIIIAHPERYLYFHDNIKKIEKLKAYGIYFQLNLLSITGYYGKNIQKIAEQLITKELYDFSGTDIHNIHQVNQLMTKPILCSDKNKIGDLLKENVFFDRII